MSTAGQGGALGYDLRLHDYPLGADLEMSNTGDIDIASNSMNLAQAILHRLRTVKGELSELGHPDYGSTIFDFIGQPNNWVTRERLRLAIRDTIRQERRVKEMISITVKPKLESTAVGAAEKSGIKKGKLLETGKFSELVTDHVSDEQYFPVSSELQNSVDIEIVIVAVGSSNPVRLSFPFNLEVA